MRRSDKETGEAAARRAIIETALAMSRTGLSPGRSGNVSCRWRDGMLITPTGMPYEDLEPGDVAFVAGDGTATEGERKPSSEWRFHLAAYRTRADCNAVVHTHSLHATALACAHKPIPAFHYMVAVAGGDDVPVVPYASFGTAELAKHVAKGLRDRKACLMANHGQIATGNCLSSALELAQEVEILAAQYCQVLAIGGEKLLSGGQMKTALRRFKSYGQRTRE